LDESGFAIDVVTVQIMGEKKGKVKVKYALTNKLQVAIMALSKTMMGRSSAELAQQKVAGG